MPENTQTGPWPQALADLVATTTLGPGWEPQLWEDYDRGQGCRGLTLCLLVTCQDTYHPDEQRRIAHLFPVEAAAYDYRAWQRWLLDRYLDALRHEACENFIVDGERPYAPNHGPGRDPYVIHEYATDEQRRTSFRGEVKQ